ncbi:gamma-glutamylcyclotransferase family protein [Vreelandella sp. EE22]
MVWVKRTIWGLFLILAGTALWLWLTMLSPWFYDRPEHLAPIEQRSHQVFVYGTLRFAPVRWVVMYSGGAPEPATLEGFSREGLDITPSPQDEVPGLALTVTPAELARLDRYERLGVRYRREELVLEGGEHAWVYRRLPEARPRQVTASRRKALVGYSQPAANDVLYTPAETLLFKETL